MAKGLKSLIRLSQWQVDERRRELGAVLDELAHAENTRRQLEEEVLQEQASAADSPQEAGLFIGAYVDRVIARREELRQLIIDIEARVEQAREVLNEAYRELKKYEMVDKTRIEREKRDRDQKEQAVLDELALQKFSNGAAVDTES